MRRGRVAAIGPVAVEVAEPPAEQVREAAPVQRVPDRDAGGEEGEHSPASTTIARSAMSGPEPPRSRVARRAAPVAAATATMPSAHSSGVGVSSEA